MNKFTQFYSEEFQKSSGLTRDALSSFIRALGRDAEGFGARYVRGVKSSLDSPLKGLIESPGVFLRGVTRNVPRAAANFRKSLEEAIPEFVQRELARARQSGRLVNLSGLMNGRDKLLSRLDRTLKKTTRKSKGGDSIAGALGKATPIGLPVSAIGAALGLSQVLNKE